MTSVPRPEYPRPQMRRTEWMCLNGPWEFQIDHADTGLERGLVHAPFDSTILVPFAPESVASGIGHPDFLEAVWYRRQLRVPESWRDQDLLIHFGGVDYDATVWVDGVERHRHRGCWAPFEVHLAGPQREELTVVVRARDPRRGPQARGKQANWALPSHCLYQRTTGIWQTVWAEPVSPARMGRPRTTPDLGAGSLLVEVPVSPAGRTGTLTVSVSSGGREVASSSRRLLGDLTGVLSLALPPEDVRAWSPDDPHLYDLRLELRDDEGRLTDALDSYAGLRSVGIRGREVLLNGQPVFQQLVLDQGLWPDTSLTAPTDDALVRDIELAMAAGFNGARVHQRPAEERWLYHADRLGYLVWGEFGDWGVGGFGRPDDHQQPDTSFVGQWLEVLERDYSHPSIIGWCPLNETFQTLTDRFTALDDITLGMFLATKAADRTRPVIDTSGYAHRVPQTDIWDAHSYEQSGERLRELLAGLDEGDVFENVGPNGERWSVPYAGQPYFMSEFGGMWWAPQDSSDSGQNQQASWGYGQRVHDLEEYYDRFAQQSAALSSTRAMFGYGFTQLTDVMQEKNGRYDEERRPKVDIARIRQIQRANLATWRAAPLIAARLRAERPSHDSPA